MSDKKGQIDDCWKKIGVWGDSAKRCPKLESVMHCANCEIYIDVGRKLLESETPPGYLDEWATLLSISDENRKQSTVSAAVFRLGDEWLALPIAVFEEVVSFRSIHRIPHRKSPILKGLVNIRGELQLCVSLGQLLNITRGEMAGTNVVKGIYERLIVISYGGVRYAFPVSEMKGVYRYDMADLMDAPATAMHCTVHYIKGMLNWKGKHIGLIDHELLFPSLERGVM